MKNILVLGLLMMMGSAAAQAAEPVNVVKVSRSGNRMPGPGPRPTRMDSVQMEVHVATSGCTDAGDFAVKVTETQAGEAKITIDRITPDTCKGFFPEGTVITLSTRVSEGVKTIQVTNPQLVDEMYAE